MIYKYSTIGKILRICILISLTVVSLSGCGQNGKQDYDMQLHVQTGVHLLQTTLNQMKNRIQEAKEEIKNRNMPEIEARNSSVEVIIHNAEEYQAFVGCLEEYMDYGILYLELEETDTVIYLDEILAYHNFSILEIEHGGTIAVRNIENLNADPLRHIELYHPYAIEENVLSQIPNLQYITVRLNSWYIGTLPTKELLHNTDCTNIAMIWDDDRKEEVNLEEFIEWEDINAMLSENIRYLKAIYILNEDDYDFISYEFCGEEPKKECEAFICIKDSESHGEKYFDILEVPVESIEMYWLDKSRVLLEDLNFDGYCDIIFRGDNDLGRNWCLGFLWNEKEQRYELNTTVPKFFKWIDADRKRITYSYHLSLYEEFYYIYEYNGSVFTEKKLEYTTGSMTEVKYTWQYYEDGELLKRLVKTYDENNELYFITYEENGIVTEKVIEKNDYKYTYSYELGEEYFPEFDFYIMG